MSRKDKVDEEKIYNLADYATSPHFNEAERAALEYADCMTRLPAEVPDELFARLKEHFNDQQIVELTSAIAWENYRTRFNHALKIEADGFSEGAYCPVPVTVSQYAAGQ